MDIFKLDIADYEAKAKLDKEREEKEKQEQVFNLMVGCSGFMPSGFVISTGLHCPHMPLFSGTINIPQIWGT